MKPTLTDFLKRDDDGVDVEIRNPFDRLPLGLMDSDQLVLVGEEVGDEMAAVVGVQLVVDGPQQGVAEPEDVVALVQLQNKDCVDCVHGLGKKNED